MTRPLTRLERFVALVERHRARKAAQAAQAAQPKPQPVKAG